MCRHVIIEAVEDLGGFADGETRCRCDRRDQAFEAFAGLGEFGRDDRAFVGDLTAHVGGDEADDAFGLRGANARAGVDAAGADRVEPETAVGVEHHLDDGGIGQGSGDHGSERGPQHLPAARIGFLSEGHQISHDRSPMRVWRGRWV